MDRRINQSQWTGWGAPGTPEPNDHYRSRVRKDISDQKRKLSYWVKPTLPSGRYVWIPYGANAEDVAEKEKIILEELTAMGAEISHGHVEEWHEFPIKAIFAMWPKEE